MKILIIGFQRSGTTLLRRIFHTHPDIRRMFHEEFLLRKCKVKPKLMYYLMNFDIDPDRDNWGEKVPFYPSARGISVRKYCETWNQYFGNSGRIVHIIRHPIDIAFSVDKKYRVKNFKKTLAMYKRIMPIVINNLAAMNNAFSFKYEDLLIEPDKKVREIMKFCGLRNFDYKNRLSKIANEKYQKIDPTRAFAYKKTSAGTKIRLKALTKILNQVPGPKYEG